MVSIDLKNREYPPFLAVPHRPDRFGAMIPQGAKNVAVGLIKYVALPKALNEAWLIFQVLMVRIHFPPAVSQANFARGFSGRHDARLRCVGKGDMEAQLEQTFQNLDRCLKATGATWADVVKTNTFVTDFDEFQKCADIRMR